VWLDFNQINGVEGEGEDNRVSKMIRLKQNVIKDDCLAYLRTSLMQKYDKEMQRHLLVSSPIDPEFEMIVVACAINLFEGLFKSRFVDKKGSTTIQ